MNPWWIFALYSIILGAVVGSFLNVVMLRLPEGRSLWPRSACASCLTPVAPRDNIPVVSWIILRGRCRSCGAPISPQYPLIEALTAALGFLSFVRFVPDLSSLDWAHGAAWLTGFSFLALLVVVAFVDLRHQIILDETSIYAVIPAIGAVSVTHALGYDGWLAISWQASVLGAAVGGGSMAMLYAVVRFLVRADGVGWGDVKLVAMMGAFLGPVPGLFLTVLIGSLLGSVWGLARLVITWEREMMPMGPPFALGAVLYMLYGDTLQARVFPGVGAWGALMNYLGWG